MSALRHNGLCGQVEASAGDPCGKGCPMVLATIEQVQRRQVLDSLMVGRLERKSERMESIWRSVACDWNQTLLVATASAMGAPYDKEPFEALARRVTYQMCMKESGSALGVEALFMGCGALLARGDEAAQRCAADPQAADDHLRALEREFLYLCSKYDVGPIDRGLWRRARRRPAASPRFRVAQLAAIVGSGHFSFDALLGCRTLSDVEELLAVDVSSYWAARGGVSHIGRDKVAMLAINLVVPLQLAYARIMSSVEVHSQALRLLVGLPAERNRVVSQWTGCGVVCRNAGESQALLELQSFCDSALCQRCPLAKVVKNR